MDDMNSSKNTARLAGLLWLLSFAATGFSLGYVRTKLIVLGDAALTASNIMANESLFRAAIVSNLFSHIFLLFLGLTLYHLFRNVHKLLTTVLLTSLVISVAIAVVNILGQLGALAVLSQADYLKAFTAEQLQAIAMIFLRDQLSNQFSNIGNNLT